MDCFLTHWLLMTGILFVIQRIYRKQFKCNYIRNKNRFLNLFLHFWNLHQILNILSKKKMILIAHVFPKIGKAKDAVRWMFKMTRFRKPSETQDAKTSETWLKAAWQYFYHIFWSLLQRLSCKMSVLVICKILGPFVNTLIVDNKYSLCYTEHADFSSLWNQLACWMSKGVLTFN